MNDSLKLFPFQVEGVNFLKSRSRCLLHDEMGLGKTVQALAGASEFSRVLVICPASLIIQWEREAKIWCPNVFLEIYSYNYIQDKRNALRLGAVKWDCVIADECQAVSNWEAKQTQNFTQHVIKNSKRVWLLSGTPATRSAANWHPLLSIIEPGKWGKSEAFYSRFCERKEIVIKFKRGGKVFTKTVVNWVGWKQTEFLNKAVKAVSLRRTIEQVGQQMPQKFYSDIYLDVKSGLLAGLNLTLSKTDLETVDSCVLNEKPVPPHLNKIRQIVGVAKIESYLELIEDVTKPLIIFAWHTAVINEITSELVKRGKKVESIIGSDLFPHRQRVVDDFEKGKLDCLVLSIACCGVGLNLPRAEMVDIFEPPWSAALMDQAIARAIRISSKNDRVLIRFILAPGTVDERVKAALNSKRIGMLSVVNG